jgi:antitoxin component of RelBE/YafQ-DinJ toxin-antitoxin module
MQKLTLSVDQDVIRRAKQLASREGTSVSRLVESFLREAAAREPTPIPSVPPILRRLRGCMKGEGTNASKAYHAHLEAKYR